MSGTFILSLDTELAWGTFDLGGLKTYKKHFDAWRENTHALIDLLEKYQIKATWDMVGHLFLDSCEKENNIAHPDVVAPSYKEAYRRWRSFDPCSNRFEDPYWYGRDVFERVNTMFPLQEIGTHTFSHVIMTDKECTQEVAYSELRKCVELAAKEGITMRSIVFPRNKITHLDVAYKLGFRVFRGLERNFYQSFPMVIQRIFSFITKILASVPSSYRLGDLLLKEGLLEIPASLYLLSYDGFLRRLIPSRSRVLQAKKGIDQAIASESLFHLWFHPFNLGSSKRMLEDVEHILAYAKEKMDAGELDNKTMGEVEETWQKQYGSKRNGIVVLTSHKLVNYFLVNTIAKEFSVIGVVYEHRGFLKIVSMFSRRTRKLGMRKVLGQVLFLFLQKFFLAFVSRRKVEQLFGHGMADVPLLPSVDVRDINSKEVLDFILAKKPVAIVVSGTSILRKLLLSLPLAFINIHAGITPAYRGVYGGFWAIYNKDLQNLGVTIHLVDEGVDTGSILYQGRIALDPRFDTIDTIIAKQYVKGTELMKYALGDIYKGNSKQPRSRSGSGRQWYHPTINDYFRFRNILKTL